MEGTFSMTRAHRTFLALLMAGGSCLAFLRPARARNSSVVYQRRSVLGISVNLVKVDLNDPEVRVTTAVARGGVGRAEAFRSLINRAHPAAAITGTFFDTRSLLPVGDIVVQGRLLYQGIVGTGVAFTEDGRVHFVPLRAGEEQDWSPYQAVVCAGPWLVRDGVRCVRPWAEGYHDRSLYGMRPRAAIGFTRENKLLLLTVPRRVHYTHVAKIMQALGAVNALGLDGGSSTALSIRGRIIDNPSRRLTNVLMVYDKPYFYERAVLLDRLAPHPKPVAPTPCRPKPDPPAAAPPQILPVPALPADAAAATNDVTLDLLPVRPAP